MTWPGVCALAERAVPMSIEEQAAKLKLIAQKYKVKLEAAQQELEMMSAIKEENQSLQFEVHPPSPLLDK